MSQKKQSDVPENIVSSDSVRGKKLLNRVQIISIGLVVVVLILAGILFIYITQKTKTPSQSQKSTVVTTKQQVVNAQNELKNATSAQQKSNAYYDLGSAYLSNSQPSQAITAYQNVKQSSSNELGIAVGLGYSYSMTGQNSQAITYFQQVVSLLEQSNDPVAKDKIPTYQNLVQRLQQGESI